MAWLVLIIEDDENMANLERRFLEKDGFRALVAHSGGEALDMMKEGASPDLLLIDYRLPDMTGVEVMRRVKAELGKSVPSVIVTGGGDESIAVSAMKLGARDYIVKDRETIRQLPATCREVLREFDLARENARIMEELSKRDDLTKIYNRRFLMETLAFEMDKVRRYGTPLSFAIFDLDHFKSVNDTYGHVAGDEVLKQFSVLLGNRLRKTDVLGRYGGEEFAVILTGTPLDRALAICGELRELVCQSSFGNPDNPIKITTSAGVAAMVGDMSERALIDLADRSLYRAKDLGRNLVAALQVP
ncbi:MAG: hypothetical protein Kow0025_01830 [Thermodesulfovibrionales bacterium]